MSTQAWTRHPSFKFSAKNNTNPKKTPSVFFNTEGEASGYRGYNTHAQATGQNPIALGSRQRTRYIGEGLAGIGADRANRRQAHDDNQGQHNGILNRGWAIFRNEETT
jgi:hypothetical protein